jgi:hypothetical protein
VEHCDRRTALRSLVSGAVGTATSALWVDSLAALAHHHAHTQTAQAGVTTETWIPRVLTAAQDDTVVVLTELIIPETDTPGAKAVRVNRFIDAVLHEAPAGERDMFIRGLAWVDERSRALFTKDFRAATVAEQTSLLTRLSSEESNARADALGVQFFRAIKSMTIDGYYTSQAGLRQELGDNGQLFLPQFTGCDHPAHQD